MSRSDELKKQLRAISLRDFSAFILSSRDRVEEKNNWINCNLSIHLGESIRRLLSQEDEIKLDVLKTKKKQKKNREVAKFSKRFFRQLPN